MKKRVLIVSRNKLQGNKISNHVLMAGLCQETYLAEDIGHAYEVLMTVAIDIFIVDIILFSYKPGDASGVRFVGQIRQIPRYAMTPVILLSMQKDAARQVSVNLKGMNYMVKTSEYIKLTEMLLMMLEYGTPREESGDVYLRKKGNLFSFQVQDIVYVESVEHLMKFHLADDAVKVFSYKTCHEVLLEVDSDVFFQCSRNVVINRNYIDCIDVPHRRIILKNNMGKIVVGHTYRKNLINDFYS